MVIPSAAEIGMALAGGALIGLSASLFLYANGKIAGISGLLGGVIERRSDALERAAFLLGLVVAGVGLRLLAPGVFELARPSVGAAAAAGLLVGFGTRLGNGCTSGHGVCGLSRFSPRSLVATLTFIATGALGVLAVRWFGGA